MNAPAIVPTITQRVRGFLAAQGATLRPWTGLQETYDELYALLRRRRSDPEFWQPLQGLLRDVVDSAADPRRPGRLANVHAELLGSWKIDELANELRESLPPEADGPWPARIEFTRRLSSAVLGGFLLLGLAAAGCGDDSKTPLADGHDGGGGAGGQMISTDGTAGTGGTSGGPGGMGGGSVAADAAVDASKGADADAELATDVNGEAGLAPVCSLKVASELDQAIAQSSLTADEKSRMCACFAALTTDWVTSLTQLFATATPAEISRMLAGLTSCCSSSGLATLRGINAAPTSGDLDKIRSGAGYYFCAVPVYKGVSFPE